MFDTRISIPTARRVVALVLMLLANAAQAQICHVTTDGTDSADGSAWGQSMDLHTALGTSSCAEIWVAGGTYTPTNDGNRSISFVIDRQLKLYGSFDGTETSRDQRIRGAHPTILSGNIGDELVNTDNSEHVVFIDGTSTPITVDTVIDGVNISAGYGEFGGGVFCEGTGSGSECSPTFHDVAFNDNYVTLGGGAMYNEGGFGGDSSPVLTAVTFSNNTSDGRGGAILSSGAYSGNSSPVLTSVTFTNNVSRSNGGAILFEGIEGNSNPVLRFVTFIGNSGRYGGAVYTNALLGNGNVLLEHVVAWGNRPSSFDAYISEFTITDSLIEGGCPDVNDVASCTNISDTDPLLGPLQDNGGPTLTHLPAAGSPVIDAGTSCVATDQRGVTRPKGIACDLGAVEVEQYILSANVGAGGQVSATATPVAAAGDISGCDVAGGDNCSASYNAGEVVNLEASPATGMGFGGWAGDCAGNNVTTSVTLYSDKTCSASFFPLQPALGVSPATTDFGVVVIGATSAAGTVTLSNTGTASLDVSALTAANAPFTAMGGSCGTVPFSVAPAASCTLDYTFTPTTAGAAQQLLTVMSNHPGGDVSFTLQGTGRLPDPHGLAVAVIGEGQVDAGASPVPRAGAISACTDAGGANCTADYHPGDIVSLSAAAASNWVFDSWSGDCAGDATPTSVTMNTAKVCTATFVGIPVLELDRTDVDFGDVEVDESSNVETITLANTGTADLDVANMDAASTPFSVEGGSCGAAPFTVPAGASCTVDYQYSPVAEGAAEQVISITSNDAGSPTMFTLAGNGYKLQRSFSGPLPSGTTGTISFTTADPRCSFSSDSAFFPAEGITPAPPERLELADGLAGFTIGNCAPGASVTLSIDYGVPLDPTLQVWKVADPWRALTTTVVGSTVTYTITDGGPNDDDGALNGVIVDPAGAGQMVAPPPTAAIPVPVDARWALWLLVLLMGAIAAPLAWQRGK